MVLSPSAPRAALACLLVSGCAQVSLPALPDDVPPSWHQPIAHGAPLPAPDLQGWWKVFQDPDLDALVEQALAQNLQVAQAGSRLRQARLLSRVDRTSYLPSLSFSINTLQDAAAIDSYLHAGLDASWELGVFGRQEALEKMSQARIGQAVAAQQAARVAVVAEVVRQYMILKSAEYDAALRQKMLALDKQALSLQAVRREARLGSMEERQAIEQRRVQSRLQLTDSTLTAAQARQALAVLLARMTPDEQVGAAAAAPPKISPFRLNQVPADLLRYRPDIRMAEAEVMQAAGELGQARAEQYPRVVLGTSYVYSYNLTQRRSLKQSDDISVGPLVDIPLFDWGRRRATADARAEALKASLMAYRHALVSAVGETESALSALTQAFERAAQTEELRRLAESQLSRQATRVRLGLSSELEHADSERAALEARVELANAQWACALAVVVVYKTLGGAPWAQAAEAAQSGAEPPAQMP